MFVHKDTIVQWVLLILYLAPKEHLVTELDWKLRLTVYCVQLVVTVLRQE